MTINIKDVLTLSDNNKYVVVSKANYENRTYYYLANIDEENNTIRDLVIYYEDGNDFVEENSENVVKNLLPLFYENAKKVLPKELFDLIEKK